MSKDQNSNHTFSQKYNSMTSSEPSPLSSTFDIRPYAGDSWEPGHVQVRSGPAFSQHCSRLTIVECAHRLRFGPIRCLSPHAESGKVQCLPAELTCAIEPSTRVPVWTDATVSPLENPARAGSLVYRTQLTKDA